MIVIKESESRRGPTDAASTVKLNLEAKSSFESVSTCRNLNIYIFRVVLSFNMDFIIIKRTHS